MFERKKSASFHQSPVSSDFSWPPMAPVYIPNCTARLRFSPITVAKRQVPWTPALTPNQAEIKFKKASVFHGNLYDIWRTRKFPMLFFAVGVKGGDNAQTYWRLVEGSDQKHVEFLALEKACTTQPPKRIHTSKLTCSLCKGTSLKGKWSFQPSNFGDMLVWG